MEEDNQALFESMEDASSEEGFMSEESTPTNTGTKTAVAKPVYQQASFSKISELDMEETKGRKDINADGRWLTIKSVRVTEPQTSDMKPILPDGSNLIPPEEQITKDGRVLTFYNLKLEVRYIEDNIKEYYPSLRRWVNKGTIAPYVKIDRDGDTKISQIFKICVSRMSEAVNYSGFKRAEELKNFTPKGGFKLVMEEVTDKRVLRVEPNQRGAFTEVEKRISDGEFYDWLIGKQVLIKATPWKFNGRQGIRNDIVDIKI